MKLATRSVQVWSSDQARCLFGTPRKHALQLVEEGKGVIVSRTAIRLLPSMRLVPEDRDSRISHCRYSCRERELHGQPWTFKFLHPDNAWAFRQSVTDCLKSPC